MKIRQEQFFENMQKAQSQYLEELKSLRTRQDKMVNQQNNFYRQIKREQEKTIKEIEEVKKFQVNQTLMGARRTMEEKLEERVHETRNEIIEMRKQIRDWTRNASSREGKKCKRKLGKQENRGTEKTEHSRLGVAELASILIPIQHSMPRSDARRLGVNGVARKLALHQGLNA
ncbi:hypothetical protein PIB30_070175 [Stylosanthes scabra]|uniref:Uncharacterized protein n=1 Tax=Stylosanthes scabra TaxID=79078 RepID=A0ABU6VM06_9FABA|nr:hypothetical protein [Stylosanthes scabra]